MQAKAMESWSAQGGAGTGRRSRLGRWFTRLLGRNPRPLPRHPARTDDSGYYATQLADRQGDTRLFAPWAQRAPDLRAQRHDDASGVNALVRLFSHDATLAGLGAQGLGTLASYMEYAEVDAGKRIIGQDEQGDYLLILLQGAVAEDRHQPSGARVRLGEVRAGEVLGELSMLDGTTRLCSCTALTPVHVAVLTQAGLARLMAEQPGLAAVLLVWLGKRLSMRLRQVSARASVLLTRLSRPDAK